MAIPNILLDQIQKGQTVLFLGAGASLGAEHPFSKQPPIGNQLADALNDEFLGGEFKNVALDKVAELAISETDLITVQEFVRDIYYEFIPGKLHKNIPLIPWKAIVTTNYDLIIERAYDDVKERVQQPVVFKKDSEPVDKKLTSIEHFPYLKLHGCITDIHDKDIPLILTPSQYIAHRKNRTRLFSRLEELAYEHAFIFAGYSLTDINIRAIMLELEQLGDTKPRSYIVTPRLSEAEKRMWLAKRITPIEITFENFLNEIIGSFGSGLGRLVVKSISNSHPIMRKFDGASERNPSQAFWDFLNTQVEFIHTGIKSEVTDPKAFYKGYFEHWSPIEMNLDVPRNISKDIMVEIFLEDESDRSKSQELICIKGHAGSGKSVLLKRIAWDAALKLDKLCIFYSGRLAIDPEALLELYILTKERIFLFIDSAAENEYMISKLLEFSTLNKILLTIITTERYNEWNEGCMRLDSNLDNVYELNFLNKKEIVGLLDLLETYKSLGHLESLSEKERIHEFEIRAERQLLVALHEVTYGKPLSDIVIDEYNSIKSQRARLLYITVAILHRLGVRTRAGVVSRLHKISFSSFKEDLYLPLQYIVFDEKDRITGDIYYRTRHQHIAEVLFEQILSKQDDRFYYYSQIISTLDIGYESDREAFRGMTKAKELTRIFGKQEYIKDIFDVATLQVADDASLLQQRAIFKMSRTGGDLTVAEELLKLARELVPWKRSISHSLAELQLKRLGRAENDFEREKYRRSTYALANKLISTDGGTPHAHHTLLKLGIIDLEASLKNGDPIEIHTKIKEFEQNMTQALREFPNESFILDAEAQYKTIANRHPEALLALEKAFESNKRIAYVALRLAATYVGLDRPQDAIKVLKESANLAPINKDINYRLAKLLISNGGNNADIKHYLRASFVKGGSGYEAQFLYARLLYIEGTFNEANQIFKNTDASSGDPKLKKEPRELILHNSKPEIFRGTMNSIHASYAFLTRDGYSDKLFVHKEYPHICTWDSLRSNQRVKFNIGFTYKGPVAINVSFE